MACSTAPPVATAAATIAAVLVRTGAVAAFAVSAARIPPPPVANPGMTAESRCATAGLAAASGGRSARRTPRQTGQRSRCTFAARSSEPASSAARVPAQLIAGSSPPTAITRLRRARAASPSTSPAVMPRASPASPAPKPSHSRRTNASRSGTGQRPEGLLCGAHLVAQLRRLLHAACRRWIEAVVQRANRGPPSRLAKPSHALVARDPQHPGTRLQYGRPARQRPVHGEERRLGCVLRILTAPEQVPRVPEHGLAVPLVERLGGTTGVPRQNSTTPRPRTNRGRGGYLARSRCHNDTLDPVSE